MGNKTIEFTIKCDGEDPFKINLDEDSLKEFLDIFLPQVNWDDVRNNTITEYNFKDDLLEFERMKNTAAKRMALYNQPQPQPVPQPVPEEPEQQLATEAPSSDKDQDKKMVINSKNNKYIYVDSDVVAILGISDLGSSEAKVVDSNVYEIIEKINGAEGEEKAALIEQLTEHMAKIETVDLTDPELSDHDNDSETDREKTEIKKIEDKMEEFAKKIKQYMYSYEPEKVVDSLSAARNSDIRHKEQEFKQLIDQYHEFACKNAELIYNSLDWDYSKSSEIKINITDENRNNWSKIADVLYYDYTSSNINQLLSWYDEKTLTPEDKAIRENRRFHESLLRALSSGQQGGYQGQQRGYQGQQGGYQGQQGGYQGQQRRYQGQQGRYQGQQGRYQRQQGKSRPNLQPIERIGNIDFTNGSPFEVVEKRGSTILIDRSDPNNPKKYKANIVDKIINYRSTRRLDRLPTGENSTIYNLFIKAGHNDIAEQYRLTPFNGIIGTYTIYPRSSRIDGLWGRRRASSDIRLAATLFEESGLTEVHYGKGNKRMQSVLANTRKRYMLPDRGDFSESLRKGRPSYDEQNRSALQRKYYQKRRDDLRRLEEETPNNGYDNSQIERQQDDMYDL